ncbi:MAG: hypothetical protein WDN44_05265 [Sphingomonas sp.]
MASLQGFVESIERAGIRGWVIDHDEPGRRLAVELVSKGRSISVALANKPRPDVSRSGISRTDIGFSLVPPRQVTIDIGAMEVRVVGSDFVLPVARGATSYEGVLEVVAPGRVGGWAWHTGHPAERVWILLKHGDRQLARLEASDPRSDLSALGMGDGGYGFSFDPSKHGEPLDLAGIDAVIEATGTYLHDLHGSRVRMPAAPAAPVEAKPAIAPAPVAAPPPPPTPPPAPPPPPTVAVSPELAAALRSSISLDENDSLF